MVFNSYVLDVVLSWIIWPVHLQLRIFSCGWLTWLTCLYHQAWLFSICFNGIPSDKVLQLWNNPPRLGNHYVYGHVQEQSVTNGQRVIINIPVLPYRMYRPIEIILYNNPLDTWMYVYKNYTIICMSITNAIVK